MKKLSILLFVLSLALGVSAQTTLRGPVYHNLGVAFTLPSDTLTLSSSTGTANLTTVTATGANYPIRGPLQSVAISWTATKISGTVAGTVSLQGSVDGVNYVTITGNNTVNNTTINTYTATNVATQTNVWVLQNNPFPYYRVSWTATTATFSAYQTAVLLAH